MKIDLILGNCLEKLEELPENSVDSIVTDPPYGLSFMDKDWDKGVPGVHFWQKMIRVLKPGGHLLAFGGTRTYHRMAVAIEDAGFEVRDMIEWVYGSGFPKSLNIGKAVARLQGENIPKTKGFNVAGQGIGLNPNRELRSDHPNYVKPTFDNQYDGWGTALKPAHEPICMARKPLAEKSVALNVLKYGTGGINIDESRVGTEERFNSFAGNKDTGFTADDTRTDSGKGLFAGNKDGGTLVNGRFPANLIHDNSEEVRECFPDTKSNGEYKKTGDWENTGDGKIRTWDIGYDKLNKYAGQEGNASRFFKSIIYQAKASKSERNKGCEDMEAKQYSHDGREKEIENPYQRNKSVAKNNHPTVKPIALMEYLIKMVTPKGGTVLDSFMGSGSTGVACQRLGMDFIGIELVPEYFEIANARLKVKEIIKNIT